MVKYKEDTPSILSAPKKSPKKKPPRILNKQVSRETPPNIDLSQCLSMNTVDSVSNKTPTENSPTKFSQRADELLPPPPINPDDMDQLSPNETAN